VIIRAIILTSKLLFSLPLVAQGKNDVLVMKNGDRFACEIKGLSADVLSVSLVYVDGTIAVQWSQVARLESDRLLSAIPGADGEWCGVYRQGVDYRSVRRSPNKIEIGEAEGKEVEVAQRKIIKLRQPSEGF
jgi:hypothetical protein